MKFNEYLLNIIVLCDIGFFSPLTFFSSISFLTTFLTYLPFAESRKKKCYSHCFKDFGPLLFSLNDINA